MSIQNMKVGNMNKLDTFSHTGAMSSFESTSSDYLIVRNTNSSAMTLPISMNVSFSLPFTVFKINKKNNGSDNKKLPIKKSNYSGTKLK